MRTSPILLFAIAMVVNVGMWLERFVIVVTSLHRDFLPSSWGMYYPTRWDWMTFIGTIGLFITLFFLFIRVLPMISIFEMRTIVPEAEGQGREGALSPAMPEHTCDLYGLMAEFDDPTALVAAARRTQEAGYRRLRHRSRRIPIDELFDAMDCEDRRVPLFVLIGGIVGGLSGFGLQAWVSRSPTRSTSTASRYISWPMFIPVTFELTILFAAITGGAVMIVLSGLPLPYHPVFNVARFAAREPDRFFLAIESHRPEVRSRPRPSSSCKGLGAKEINEVEA